MNAHETPAKKPRGRPRLSDKVLGRKCGFLIVYDTERVDGTTWVKCHCMGCLEGSRVCKQGREPIRIRQSNFMKGLHKSCGCMRYVREPRIACLRLRVEKATADDFEKLGEPVPSWLPREDEAWLEDLPNLGSIGTD